MMGTGLSDEDDHADAPALLLRVLGPVALIRNGESINIGGPRQRAVLARLAAAEGRFVSVDRLVEDLWGDAASASITTTLHGYLSRLRSSLHDPGRIRREGSGYALELAAEEVDARRFEQLAASGRQALTRDPESAVGQFEQALALWRGPAYADLTDMDWARVAATRLDELRWSVAEARFDAMLQLGWHDAMIASIEEAMHENPLRERFAAQLMLGLYRAGRQSEALRTYERTRRLLLDELGLDPSPELVRLEAAILAHEPWLAAPEPPRPVPGPEAAPVDGAQPNSLAAPRSPVALPPAVERHLRRPFVGRTAELAQLADAWRDALDGQRRLVVIEGEAGSGKSRLAAHFAEQAHADGAIVMWGRSTTEAVVPYEPLVEALRTVLRTVSPDARQRVISGRDGLAMLVPFLSGGDFDGPDPGANPAEPVTDRYVLFETVAELLDAESAAWPIVVVLDDLQWTDRLSMRLLQHVLQHERSARILAIGTLRTVPVTDNPDLDALLSSLHRDAILRRVRLDGLDERDVAELLDVIGEGTGGARAAAVHRATRGNPFFVTELASHGDARTLPASIRDVLSERLGRVSPAATRLLSVSAVGGPTVPLAALASAAGLADLDFVDAVDEAIRAGLLSEEDGSNADSSGSISFKHSLVQQAVLERLSRARRQALHLALADALQASGASRMEIAHHLREAGGLSPAERTVRAAIGAGEQALALLAYEDAQTWAQRAVEIAGHAEPHLRCEALLLRSDAERALGDRVVAREAAVEAAEEARKARDPMLLARAAEAMALARSGLGFDFGTEDQGLDRLLLEALNGLPDSEVVHRSRLLGASLANAAADGDLPALRGLSRDALALAEALGQPSLVATAHLSSRMANWNVRLLDERLDADRQAWAAAEQSDSTHLQMNALLYGIADLTEAGLVHEALDWLERLRVRAARVRQPVYDAFVGFMDATRLLLQGEYARSAQLADDALVRGLQSHGVNAEMAWAAQTFIRAWDRGELAGLTDIVEQAAGQPPHLAIWGAGRALCLIASGRPEEARPVLEAFVSEAGVKHNPDSLWLALTSLLVEVARAVDDRDRAAILLRELLPYRGRMVMTGLGRASLGPADRFVGVAAHVAGDLQLADEALAAAVEQARSMAAVPHVARALFDRAAVVHDLRGDDAEAEALRQRARRLADRVGLVLDSLAVSPSS